MAADAFMRGMMITAAKLERVIDIWKHKHSYNEVAWCSMASITT